MRNSVLSLVEIQNSHLCSWSTSFKSKELPCLRVQIFNEMYRFAHILLNYKGKTLKRIVTSLLEIYLETKLNTDRGICLSRRFLFPCKNHHLYRISRVYVTYCQKNIHHSNFILLLWLSLLRDGDFLWLKPLQQNAMQIKTAYMQQRLYYKSLNVPCRMFEHPVLNRVSRILLTVKCQAVV